MRLLRRSVWHGVRPLRSTRSAIIILGLVGGLMPLWAGPASAVRGKVSEFPLAPQSAPSGITSGTDRSVWFTEYGTNAIGHLSPGGGLSHFAIPTPNSSPA